MVGESEEKQVSVTRYEQTRSGVDRSAPLVLTVPNRPPTVTYFFPEPLAATLQRLSDKFGVQPVARSGEHLHRFFR